jgi:hypothetical protein
MIVGITGYAGSGKDALGKCFVSNHGYTRVAFADAVKLMALEHHGWDGRKDDAGRALLQEVGSMMRDEYEHYWVDAAFAEAAKYEHVVMTDVRYPNELARLRQLGGVFVRIIRPGVGPVNDHPSETALDDQPADVTVINDATIDKLELCAAAIATRVAYIR